MTHPQDPEPTKAEKIELLIDTFDSLAIARARQRVWMMLGDAENASANAEDAVKSKELLRKQLELML